MVAIANFKPSNLDKSSVVVVLQSNTISSRLASNWFILDKSIWIAIITALSDLRE